MHVSHLLRNAEFHGAGTHVAHTAAASPAQKVSSPSSLATPAPTAAEASPKAAAACTTAACTTAGCTAAACTAAAKDASPALHSQGLHDSPAWQVTLQSLLALAGHVLVPAGFLVTWLPYSANPSYHLWLRNQGVLRGLQLQSLLAEQRRSGLARGVAVFRKGLPAGVQKPYLNPTLGAAAKFESACTCCAITTTRSQNCVVTGLMDSEHSSTAGQDALHSTDQRSAALTEHFSTCMSLPVGAGHVQTAPAAAQPGLLATAQVAAFELQGTAPLAQSGVLEAAPVALVVLPPPAPAAQPGALATALPTAHVEHSASLTPSASTQLMMRTEQELTRHDVQLVPVTNGSTAGSQPESARSTSRANSRHTSVDACR